jgi:FkbM family methyltransferase
MGTLQVKHYWIKRVLNLFFNEKWYNKIKLAKIILNYKLGNRYEASPLFRYLFNSDSTMLDIGANVGQYACRLNDVVSDAGQIYSFEPVAINYGALNSMKKILKLRNVSIHNMGISNYVGEATINIPILEGGLVTGTLASLKKYQDNIKSRTKTIDVTTVDSFVSENSIQNIDFIKSDTEENGNNVLEVGKQTITKFLPILSVEMFYNIEMSRENKHLNWLLELGYKPYYYDSKSNKLRKVNGKQKGNLILLTDKWINRFENKPLLFGDDAQ